METINCDDRSLSFGIYLLEGHEMVGWRDPIDFYVWKKAGNLHQFHCSLGLIDFDVCEKFELFDGFDFGD